MSIVVNTNVPSLKVQRNLNEATNALNEAVERMTTGLKINKAADDSAGLYIASGLDNQIRGSEIAEGNVETGINLLQIAEGDLTLIQEHVSRIRDLATEAASDYYTADARTAMAAEASARLAEINRLAAASNFNGKKLLEKLESVKTEKDKTAEDTLNALTEALVQSPIEDLLDPTVQQNLFLAQILRVVQGIFQQNNTQGKLKLPDAIAALATGMTVSEVGATGSTGTGTQTS